MTDIEQAITLRKTIRSLYIQNIIAKSIIEDFFIGIPEGYLEMFTNKIPSYEETVKLLEETWMK